VIIPSFTFVSTVNAFVLRGARPVFIDIRPDTLNLDENQLERLITKRTKAIVPVHYAGVGCEMDAIMEIANRHGVAVIEDNAHGLFAKYNGKYLGTFGCMATRVFTKPRIHLRRGWRAADQRSQLHRAGRFLRKGHPGPLDVAGIVDQQRATLAAGEILGFVKTLRGHAPKRSRYLPLYLAKSPWALSSITATP